MRKVKGALVKELVEDIEPFQTVKSEQPEFEGRSEVAGSPSLAAGSLTIGARDDLGLVIGVLYSKH